MDLLQKKMIGYVTSKYHDFIDWVSLVYVPENGDAHVLPPSSRSIVEIFSDLQRSKLGIQDWSFGDLTVGLYLVYLSQATEKHKDTSGVPIFSESVVIYFGLAFPHLFFFF